MRGIVLSSATELFRLVTSELTLFTQQAWTMKTDKWARPASLSSSRVWELLAGRVPG